MQSPFAFSYRYCYHNDMKNLRHVREKRGISQDKLAELSGVPQNTISRIERGERTPRRSTLDKLARVLEVEHPSWLTMPVHPGKTFGELIEGTPEERRAYIESMRESGRSGQGELPRRSESLGRITGSLHARLRHQGHGRGEGDSRRGFKGRVGRKKARPPNGPEQHI
jgi:transcriptional regulator with XRE-family HTH domain